MNSFQYENLPNDMINVLLQCNLLLHVVHENNCDLTKAILWGFLWEFSGDFSEDFRCLFFAPSDRNQLNDFFYDVIEVPWKQDQKSQLLDWVTKNKTIFVSYDFLPTYRYVGYLSLWGQRLFEVIFNIWLLMS